ncbi:hypothetical protein [Chitinophaga rhizophila]|uniref:Uncharacterized protein n=1 Tax=Chitinophaga rhizophila TaxID=2866212 RepID=A0ABS7G6T5_9BACT|nr:hypothetical protein [Chitinophaga rhizophila]MBW8683365.1 hypothetical protein [Chitinophaga rhizophila]
MQYVYPDSLGHFCFRKYRSLPRYLLLHLLPRYADAMTASGNIAYYLTAAAIFNYISLHPGSYFLKRTKNMPGHTSITSSLLFS